MLLKGTKISFLGLQVLLTGLWNSKDIKNSRPNRSKNKLFRENECMEVARSELWAPVQTKSYHSPQPSLDLASNLHTYFQTWKRSQKATYTSTQAEIMSSLFTQSKTPTERPHLSYSFGVKTRNTFLHSCSSPENHTHPQNSYTQNLPLGVTKTILGTKF